MVTSLNDYQQRLATRHWVATTCEIVESSIADDGWWYRFNVVFNYRFNGRDRTGRDFTHKGGLKKWRIDDVQRMLEQYPRGTSTTCYVNPLIPDEALILRDLDLLRPIYAKEWAEFGQDIAGDLPMTAAAVLDWFATLRRQPAARVVRASNMEYSNTLPIL